jgi:hypothetical protein
MPGEQVALLAGDDAVAVVGLAPERFPGSHQPGGGDDRERRLIERRWPSTGPGTRSGGQTFRPLIG